MPGENMATVTYIAKRGLIAGHTAGVQYAVEIDIVQFDYKRKRNISESKSLSGEKTTFLHNVDQTIQIKTAPTADTAVLNQFIEFITSVEGGETFYIDELGTIATPVYPIPCTVKGDFKRDRHGRANRFSFSFEVST